MEKKYSSRNNSKAYKTLRDYVKNVLDLTSTLIDGEVADSIQVSEKTIQNISAGTRFFKWGEAKSVATYFADKAKRDADSKILRQLLRDFLLTYGTYDDAEVNDRTVDIFLDSLLGREDDLGEDESKRTLDHYYSNLPESQYSESVIREQLMLMIRDNLGGNRIVFLTGFAGTGKTFIANVIAHNFIDGFKGEYKVAIWNDCNTGNMTYNNLISNVLVAFDLRNAGNLSREEKVEYAENCLLESKSIIVVDGFEDIEGENEKKSIISFLSNVVSDNTIIIITCNERLNYYREIIEHPHLFFEIKVDNFTAEEWKELSNIYGQSRSDIREAKALLPELDDYVFTLCKGNPYLMTHVLSAVSEKVLTGFSYKKIKNEYYLSDVDPKSYDVILKKSLNDLSDNCVNLLISLSLFSTPVTLKLMSIISGLKGVDSDDSLVEGSDLAISILKCHNLFLIERFFSNGYIKFSLPGMLRPIIENELKKHANKYIQMINRWINYYVDFSRTIGFCFDNFGKLSALDGESNEREIDNIVLLLEYCEHERRWSDFYIISENTKYYFYTRGISGEGKESIHFRRSVAARNIQNYKAEFDSLLYHCNVSCKSKSWDSIEDCFNRIEELMKMLDDIPQNSILKYKYIKALYAFSTNDIDNALMLFDEYEDAIKAIMDETSNDGIDKIVLHDYIASLRWHCECIYMSIINRIDEDSNYVVTDSDLISDVDRMLDEAFSISEEINFERAMVHSQLIRIKFYLILGKDIKEIKNLFNELEAFDQVINNDAMYKKEYRKLEKKYNELTGEKRIDK